MVNVTLADYKPKKGNPKGKLPTKRELVGYVPMEKRITDLMAAGLRTAMVRDARFYDSMDGSLADLPPLPRHIPADLAEVSDLARYYEGRRAEIEQRLNAAAEERRKKEIEAKSAPEKPQEASGEVRKAPQV